MSTFNSTVSSGQVMITVSPTLNVDSGSSATLSCSYTTDASYGYRLYFVSWSMGETLRDVYKIAQFQEEGDSPVYYNNYSPPDYIAARDVANGVSTLVIASVDFYNDTGLFWCRLVLADGYSESEPIEVNVIGKKIVILTILFIIWCFSSYIILATSTTD